MDAQLRDNMDFLRTPPGGNAVSFAAVNTTSTTFVDLTSMTLTFTTQGKNIIAFFAGTLFVAAGPVDEIAVFRMVLDSNATVPLQLVRLLSTAGSFDVKPVSFHFVFTGVSAASHTVKVQWRSVGGAQITMSSGSADVRSLSAKEAWF